MKYAAVFQQTEGLNIWQFSDTTTRGNDIFLICPRVNIEVANTLQVSETDGKDIFGAKSPVLICQVKYAYAYLNHKEIYPCFGDRRVILKIAKYWGAPPKGERVHLIKHSILTLKTT